MPCAHCWRWPPEFLIPIRAARNRAMLPPATAPVLPCRDSAREAVAPRERARHVRPFRRMDTTLTNPGRTVVTRASWHLHLDAAQDVKLFVLQIVNCREEFNN